MSEVAISTTDTFPGDALSRWGVSACLRFLMHRKGGEWSAARVVTELQAIGWTTTSRYPLNVAGNMLNRLHDLDALILVRRGVYTVNRRVLDEIFDLGIREFARAQRQSVNHELENAPPS